MDRRDAMLLVVLANLILGAILWIRINIQLMEPILEDSTLFFQLVLAATVIAVLRNIVGIKTFGVFGPVIIAFGMSSAGLLWGLALYIDVFLIAMATSLALYSLGMPSSHRMATVITTTVIAITVLELLAETYHVTVLEEAILFPVLITSWLADRYVKLVKEGDWLVPSKRLLGTFATVIVAFAVISYHPLLRFIALNPETWGLLILLNVFLALKVDFRLSEYARFKPAIRASGKRGDILALNKRNRETVFRYNPSSVFPLISKDKMKAAFHQMGIPTPATYALISEKRELPFARKVMTEQESFVIKPSSGLGGEGIVVVDRLNLGEEGEPIYRAKGREFSLVELETHLKMVLEGQFSTEWEDVAILEEKIVSDPQLAPFHWKGVPDLRIIVLEGFPVMAMARLPTQESGGAANLHKGGVGIGLRIADGQGVNPYWPGHGGAIEKHPDTGAVLSELRIPGWERVLEIASLAQGVSRLGYAGVDVVLDTKGPMILEVNKRPGLEIQNTNLAGLMKRLEFVESQLLEHRFKPAHEKVLLAMDWDRRGWQ